MGRSRLRKSPSEGTLVLVNYGRTQCFEDSDDCDDSAPSMKRIADRRVGIPQDDEEARDGKFAKPSANGGRTSPLNDTDRWAATAALRMASTMDCSSPKNDLPIVTSCFATDCEQSLDTSNSSDHSDLDRFEVPEENRATLSRIGSQLALAFPPDMGISVRKKLLCNLSETVDAHDTVILHNGVPVNFMRAPSTPLSCRQNSCSPLALHDLPHSLSQRSLEEELLLRPASSFDPPGSRGNCPKYQQGAELCLRLNHARQTLSFVNLQAAKYCRLEKAELNVWEALALLDDLTECETTFLESPETEADLPLKEHSFQTAEACRLAHPTEDWLHLLGLIHDLGRLLRHKKIGAEPSWAVCGETFPVGCKFDPSITYHHYFSVNPDRRRRQYSTDFGIYSPGVGLASVYMSWSAPEYLYMLLLLNKTNIPPVALFVARYQKFLSLEKSGVYQSLMSDADLEFLPWLQQFRELSVHRRRHLPGRLEGDSFKLYYESLLEKYIPGGTLKF